MSQLQETVPIDDQPDLSQVHGLNERDREVLAMQEKDFTPHSWTELQELICMYNHLLPVLLILLGADGVRHGISTIP